MRIGALQTQAAGFQGIGGRASQAIASVGGNATQAYQVPKGSIRASQAYYDRLQEQDRIANLIRFGGYGSRQQQSQAGRAAWGKSVDAAEVVVRAFGGFNPGTITGRSSRISAMNAKLSMANSITSALSSAGLSYKTVPTVGGGRFVLARHNSYLESLAIARGFNQNQLAKATQINLLEQDFGVSGFVGSGLSLPALQDQVAIQDEKIKSIGLDRTEAFQIVDTIGRGREEIDDRILWKDRLNNISTGTTVLWHH